MPVGRSVTTVASFCVARRASGFGSWLRSLTGTAWLYRSTWFQVDQPPWRLSSRRFAPGCRMYSVAQGMAKDVCAKSPDAAAGTDALEDFR